MARFIFTGRHTKLRDKKRETYRAECKMRRLPQVTILKRRKFANVFIDTLTQPTPLTQKQIDRIELLFGQFGEDGGRLLPFADTLLVRQGAFRRVMALGNRAVANRV